VPVLAKGDVKPFGRVEHGEARFVPERLVRERGYRTTRPGDYLLTTRDLTQAADFLGLLGPIPQDREYVVNQGANVLRFRGGCDGRFLVYWCNGSIYRTYIKGHYVGSTQIHIRKDDFLDAPLWLPSLGEQEAIANVLGTLDDKIELNWRMNETLEAMARALFKSWFVDFDPVRAKAEGRDTGLPPDIADLFPDSFEDSELGEIPKGWHVEILKNVLDELEVGSRPRGGVSDYVEGIPSIGAESIVGLGVFDYSKTKYVPCTFFDRMRTGHVKSRDVLLYKDGGRPGLYEPHLTLFGDGFPFGTCAINEHVYRLRTRADLGQTFLFFWLASDGATEEMRTKGTGVAIPGLNSTQVKSLAVLVPARAVARAFDELAEPFIARVLANCNQSRTLAAARDALLPKLMSGEMRVKDTERTVEIV
jgi:type I restriction enzyme S subunit